MTESAPATVAFWYPEPYWGDSEADRVKTLLPFFDRVAILLPRYMYGRHRAANPWLAGPLEEQGLLQILEPESFVDQQMTAELCSILLGLLAAGVFDDLEIPEHRYGYQELSQSRLGWDADIALSKDLIGELERRRLALPSEDGVSVPLHPVVRTTVLVLLSQLAPRAGREQGLELLPVTSDRGRIADLIQVLGRPGMPTAGDVVGLDTEVVGLDLAEAPLDEVLAFRDAHGSAYRAYARNVRQFVRELSPVKDDERAAALEDRTEELADLAAALRRQARSYWKRPMARVGVGGAGAVISLVTGSVVPVTALAGLSALLEWEPRDTSVSGAFSYLFEIQRTIGS